MSKDGNEAAISAMVLSLNAHGLLYFIGALEGAASTRPELQQLMLGILNRLEAKKVSGDTSWHKAPGQPISSNLI